MIGKLIKIVREPRSIVVGAAVKIAALEAASGVEFTDKERQAMAGSREFWESNGDEIRGLVDQLKELEAA